MYGSKVNLFVFHNSFQSVTIAIIFGTQALRRI